jgi:hypothetical protein
MVQIETVNDMGPSASLTANGKTAVFTTTDAYAIMFTYACKGLSHKMMALTNLGAANGLMYRIKGVVMVGSTRQLDVGSSPWVDCILGKGDTQPFVMENPWGQVTVEVKSAILGLPTTCEIEFSGN